MRSGKAKWAVAFWPVISFAAHTIESPQELQVRLRIYDYAGVTAPIIEKAQREVDRLFRRCGIEVMWLPTARPAQPAAVENLSTGVSVRPDLCVRIVPAREPYRGITNSDSFGFAYVGQKLPGEYATVFYDRISRLGHIERDWTSEGALLGHVIAHELGHLLLGPGSHTPQGLMSARWTRDDIVNAAQGRLNFDRRQIRRLCDNLSRREAAGK
jgi:hypothetical protein